MKIKWDNMGKFRDLELVITIEHCLIKKNSEAIFLFNQNSDYFNQTKLKNIRIGVILTTNSPLTTLFFWYVECNYHLL